jgi:hypothetical protein
MLRYCQLFLNGIRDEAQETNGVINITKWIDHLTFDVRRKSIKQEINELDEWSIGFGI